MHINPYLNFEGRADEAIEFYQRAIDAKVQMLMRFSAVPVPPTQPFPPSMMDKVMHATLSIGNSTIHVTDGHCSGNAAFNGITLSVSVVNEAQADHVFAALTDGGEVTMALGNTFFSPRFGMLKDRFGISWLVIAQPTNS